MNSECAQAGGMPDVFARLVILYCLTYLLLLLLSETYVSSDHPAQLLLNIPNLSIKKNQSTINVWCICQELDDFLLVS